MTPYGRASFDAALAGAGLAPEDRGLDTTVRGIQDRYGELTWAAILLTCEDQVGVGLPEALIESVDSLGELFDFLTIRAETAGR